MSLNPDAALQRVLLAEQSKPWRTEHVGTIARLLAEVAERFLQHGDLLAHETAERMGVTPGEVWLETIFPSVWGLLSTRRGLLASARRHKPLQDVKPFPRLRQRTEFGGRPALKVLPATLLERLLLPGFSGYVLLKETSGGTRKASGPQATSRAGGLALCLLPFNLASIGVLDVAHLLCVRQQRVVAKVSEKVEFVGPLLEQILAPLIEAGALQVVFGGPEVGASLAARPEFSHIHLTGSARTAATVARIGGPEKLTSELGGATLAIVLPDALATDAGRRAVARQIAFGVLANNGQHCVSFQIVAVPASDELAFAELLWHELRLAASRQGGTIAGRKLVDAAAARRLEAWTASLAAAGARSTPSRPQAHSEYFPACLVQGISETMAIFSEEAFGPVAGLLPLPVESFAEQAKAVANSARLSGDLGISLFTSHPHSSGIRQLALQLRHGVVTINTYPGVAFATSLPWGAGPAQMSGGGWTHNYSLLPEDELEKVVLTAPLGRKGFGPIRWEDPWLLNTSGEATAGFGRALVQLTLAYFLKRPWQLAQAQPALIRAIRRREAAARRTDRMGTQ